MVSASHGPFAWGRDAAQTVYRAAVPEGMAKMAILKKSGGPYLICIAERFAIRTADVV